VGTHQWLAVAPTALDPNTIIISCRADQKDIQSVHNLGYTIHHSEYVMRSILKQSWEWDTSGYRHVVCGWWVHMWAGHDLLGASLACIYCFFFFLFFLFSFFFPQSFETQASMLFVGWFVCDSPAIDNYLAPVMLQAKKGTGIGSKKK
jgi:hypothetical protein